MVSVCADAQNRITGVCPDNLTGGNGWSWIDCCLTPQTELCDACGVARYKLVDGAVVPRTQEEMDADAPEPVTPELTDVEKLKIRQDATEDAVLFLMDMSMGGML